MRHVMSLLLVVFCLGACTQAPPSPPATTAKASLTGDAVPQELRHLTPLAQKWGVGDDVERGALTEKATPAEKEALRAAAGPHRERINAWLDSFGQRPMPEEAAAFMYMLEAMDEMGI